MPNEMNNILTLENDAAVETQKSKEDLIWHEITNAYRTRRILTGMLGGIEKLEGGATITIVYYKNFRVVIPITEMMINLVEDETHNYGELSLRQNKIVNTMLGCEIDFIIKGLDSKERSIVASRKDAMLKKRQIFYFDQDSSGTPKGRYSAWRHPFPREICHLTGWVMPESVFTSGIISLSGFRK